MTWVKGQSGNPKGKKPGQLNRRTQAIMADLLPKGLSPDAIGKAVVKVMAEIALDPREPKQLRIQAGNVVLPYCLPRLQVTAQLTSQSGDFSRARSKVELLEMFERECGSGAGAVLKEMMARLDAGEDATVIEAEVIGESAPVSKTTTAVERSTTDAKPASDQPELPPEPAAG
jgi:hypothetical protein